MSLSTYTYDTAALSTSADVQAGPEGGFLTTFTYDALAKEFPNPDDIAVCIIQNFGAKAWDYFRGPAYIPLSYHDAEDVQQNHSIRYVKDVRDIKPQDLVKAYFRLAHNCKVDFLRRRGRTLRTNAAAVLDVADPHCPLLDGDGWDYLSPGERDDLRALILSKVPVLPGRQQRIARLYVLHVQDFSPRDIFRRLAALLAAETGEPQNPGTVKSLWHTARKTLARALIEAYPEVFSEFALDSAAASAIAI
jgi:DNA-directed RNA polymerase specialized sigma24 family protein